VHPLIVRLLGLCLLVGCTFVNPYEAAICVQERVDTVQVIVIESQFVFVMEHECEIWQALSDSTKRWDNNGNRLP